MTTNQEGSIAEAAIALAEAAEIRLRLAPTGNNQRPRVNWANDFGFAAKLTSSGP
jgi:hypothetical protein